MGFFVGESTFRKSLFAEVNLNVPVFNLHGTILFKIEVHLEGAIPELGLVPNFATQAVSFGNVEVLVELIFILRMGALFDDTTGAILRSQSAHVSQALLGDDAVEVMLGVVDV